ncbi:MAG TPA: DUF3768 domain-containing protein [Alphaproteobacteria bacterium]|nr:DUF3768 domain-containing protein [Alphaproteobacteria bacterium]
MKKRPPRTATKAARKIKHVSYPEALHSKVRELNDQFRKSLRGGRIVVTAGVHALGPDRVQELLIQVAAFNQFSSDNDPYGEHDFGAFYDRESQFFWKIDYYDKTLTAGSSDPSDPDKTRRVLTLKFASDY